ncbi:MAG TPA: iron ABC transporter permease, partial [Bacillota bacterium]|nr:iron ABC transporter permease [Bacillota bacterium]
PVPEVLAGLAGEGSRGTLSILWDVRLPRVGLALLIGANLAASGTLLQAVMHNPLADPGLTGVSSGAAVAVLFVILTAPQWTHLIPPVALVGGVVATVMVFTFAWQRHNGFTPLRVILAGVAVNSIFGGITGMLSILHSDRLPAALQWLNGSLAGTGMDDLGTLLPYSLLGWIAALVCIRPANILRLGEQTAMGIGLNVTLARLLLCGVAVHLAAISVSTVGLIGFVGLVVPHITRMLVGSNYLVRIPFGLALGAVVLVAADTLGRTVISPLEVPAGIVMAVVGGPYFLYLMRRGGT